MGTNRQNRINVSPKEVFTKDAETVARIMSSKEVSPKGIGSAIGMVQFFINRAGKNLPENRKVELEKAKEILREKLKSEKGLLQKQLLKQTYCGPSG